MSQTPTSIGRLLGRHGLVPRKRLGQHFLADGNIIDKMVRTADVSSGDQVVEVGAGTGALTAAIAETGARVLAYEIDRRLAPVLAEVVGERPNVELRFEDAMQALPDALGAGPWKLVANLPYNVGTPLVLKLLRTAPRITRFTVMVQREVADRLVALPGTRQYGLPSIVARLTSEVHRAFVVPPQVFIPAPSVSSAVVVRSRSTTDREGHRGRSRGVSAPSQDAACNAGRRGTRTSRNLSHGASRRPRSGTIPGPCGHAG